MWQTPSNSLIILLICLLEFTQIQAQCERPVFGDNRVPADESGQTIFEEGQTVTFKCSIGYQPVQTGASRSVTCRGKQWTALALQCTKKSCGHPGEFANGRYSTPQGILFGATVTAECNEGYLVVGTRTRNCLDSGWDGRVAVCEAVRCIPLPVENGMFEPEKDDYVYNEAVTYSCIKDHTLVGESTLTCSDDGNWNPSPPRCLAIKCEAPVINDAVRVEGRAPPYRYKEFVRYKCNDGFRMEGQGFLICDVNGWNPSPPNCTAIPPDNKVDNKDDNKDDNKVDNKEPSSVTGIVVGSLFGIIILVILIVVGVYCMKKGTGWGKVPTRNEGGA